LRRRAGALLWTVLKAAQESVRKIAAAAGRPLPRGFSMRWRTHAELKRDHARMLGFDGLETLEATARLRGGGGRVKVSMEVRQSWRDGSMKPVQELAQHVVQVRFT
jgi:hypothetical protein